LKKASSLSPASSGTTYGSLPSAHSSRHSNTVQLHAVRHNAADQVQEPCVTSIIRHNIWACFSLHTSCSNSSQTQHSGQ
jgi:hypothetical protein